MIIKKCALGSIYRELVIVIGSIKSVEDVFPSAVPTAIFSASRHPIFVDNGEPGRCINRFVSHMCFIANLELQCIQARDRLLSDRRSSFLPAKPHLSWPSMTIYTKLLTHPLVIRQSDGPHPSIRRNCARPVRYMKFHSQLGLHHCETSLPCPKSIHKDLCLPARASSRCRL